MASSRKLGAHQLVNQDSGDTEYYTPGFIVEAARRVMGGIDLDPFSSAAANVLVQAGKLRRAVCFLVLWAFAVLRGRHD